jgi:hypothetical protein
LSKKKKIIVYAGFLTFDQLAVTTLNKVKVISSNPPSFSCVSCVDMSKKKKSLLKLDLPLDYNLLLIIIIIILHVRITKEGRFEPVTSILLGVVLVD